MGDSLVNCLFDVLGLAICYMLFNKQLLGHSTLVDKVCSAIQKGGCDSILESADAKFFGLISWTEIGFAYFSSRLLCCYVNNGCLAILQMIGWIAMLYGIWSIWHQAFKAKRWCALCVSVQVIVWVCGIYNIFAFLAFDTSVGVVLTYVICVVFCLLVTHTLSEYFSIRNQYLHIGKDLVSLKMRDDIFNAAINGSSKIDVGDKDSSIYYGNISASLTLTVLTNPHCAPCAGMHDRLMRLIGDNRNIRIQYIYSSFDKEMEDSSLFMIAMYQQKSYAEVIKALEDWYQFGRFDANRFIGEYDVDIHDSKVLEEYARHIRWKEISGVKATPTLIFPSFITICTINLYKSC